MDVTTCGSCGAAVATNYCTSCGHARTTSAARAAPVGVDDALAEGRRATFIGLAWMVGGTAVTFATYEVAGSGGGRYFVLWGAVIFGAYRAVRGLAQMFRAGRAPVG
jgi:hypothetical protein